MWEHRTKERQTRNERREQGNTERETDKERQ
jgi:hypothetical protein